MNTYDLVTIQIGKGEEKKNISILPTSTGVNFFCITSDQYGTTDAESGSIVYTIKSNDPTPEDMKIVLDRPHVLIGKSVLDKFGNFSKLDLKNNTERDANIRIFLGRDI